jgi:DNA-binding GntR family transcriptional regulator
MKLRERAYEKFTEHLLKREIRPGQFVTQRELVAITGMPLGAIRELIPRLEVDGLIVTVPQRGMQVAHVDLTLVRNAFQFRLFLEREAMAQFVETADDAEIARLRRNHEEVLEAAGRGVDDEVIARAQAVDWDLHDTIIDALGNQIISSAYRVNSIKIRLIRQEGTHLYDALVRPVMEDHLGIVRAIEARDAATATRLLADHITAARNRAMGL